MNFFLLKFMIFSKKNYFGLDFGLPSGRAEISLPPGWKISTFFANFWPQRGLLNRSRNEKNAHEGPPTDSSIPRSAARHAHAKLRKSQK
jgi:hypothetical protein